MTTVDVLAVSAIVVMGAACAWSVADMRHTATAESRCMANFRVIRRALSLYREDWGGQLVVRFRSS